MVINSFLTSGRPNFALQYFFPTCWYLLVEIMNFQPIFNSTSKLLLLQREKLFQWIHWDGFCGYCVLTCPGRVHQHCKYIIIWAWKKLLLDLLGQTTLLLELADFFHGVSYGKTCAYFAGVFFKYFSISLSNSSPLGSFNLQRILLVIFCDSSNSILHHLILVLLKFITTEVLAWECSYKRFKVFYSLNK